MPSQVGQGGPQGMSTGFATNSRVGWMLLVALLGVLGLSTCGGGGGGDDKTAGGGGGGGGGGGTPPTPPPACVIGSTAAINLQLTASRTSGVAPLAVFFDTAGTTATST